MQTPVPPSAEEIQAALNRITSSPTFQRSDRLCRFLTFVVTETLQGRADDLKEYLIGVEVFNKGGGFDPRMDSAVRVDARRLRAKLGEYYASEGASDRIRIDLPKGGYVPVFAHEAAAPPAQPQADTPPKSRFRIAAAAAVVLCLAAGALVYRLPRSGGKRISSGLSARSMVVLPFQNMTGSAASDALCDGLTEELIDRLAKIRGIRVVSRTSSFALKGRHSDIREIARDLQVDSVIEGSVREGGETYRITVQLIRGQDGLHIWSESFDLKKGDQLGVQSQIGETIERRLISNLPDQAGYTPELTAVEQKLNKLVVQSAYLSQRRTEESLRKAIEYAQQAIQEDGSYAPAHAVLADSMLALADFRPRSEAQTLLSRSREIAEKAIALDPTLAGPHSTLGAMKLEHERDWTEAERLFRQAIALNPDHGQTRARYARLLSFLGRPDDAMAEARKAEMLAPVSVIAIATLGQTAYYARRYEEAVSILRRALDIDPGFANGRITTARALGLLGRFDDALSVWKQQPDEARERPEVSAVMAWLHARRGDTGEARRLLAKSQGATSISLAAAYLALGDADRAIAVLEAAVRDREPNVVYVKVTPTLDPLRKDPRLEAICRSLGLSGCNY